MPTGRRDAYVVREGLPAGTVTFLFTDVEGSTRLLHDLGADGYAAALAEHRRLIREACAREGGVEVDTQGDAFFFAFPTAPGGLAAASALSEALAEGNVHVRVGVRATLDYLQQRDRSRLLKCAADLWFFWRMHDYVAEGRTWLSRGLEAEESPPGVRAEALNAAANLARLQGDFEGSAAHAEEELVLARATGDARTVAAALINLASVATVRGDIDQATARQQQAVEILRTLDDPRTLATGLGNLGYMALERGDAPNATLLLEESLSLAREAENVFGESTALLNLGAAYFRSGRMDAGTGAFEAALRTAMRVGSMEYVAYALQGIAATTSESQPQRAAELLGASGRLLDDVQTELEPIERELREAALHRVALLLGNSLSEALATGTQMETSDAVELGLEASRTSAT